MTSLETKTTFACHCDIHTFFTPQAPCVIEERESVRRRLKEHTGFQELVMWPPGGRLESLFVSTAAGG